MVGCVGEALHALVKKYPDACRSWMMEEMMAREGWPSTFVSAEDKRAFINLAIG
jgi:hypothetical protein